MYHGRRTSWHTARCVERRVVCECDYFFTWGGCKEVKLKSRTKSIMLVPMHTNTTLSLFALVSCSANCMLLLAACVCSFELCELLLTCLADFLYYLVDWGIDAFPLPPLHPLPPGLQHGEDPWSELTVRDHGAFWRKPDFKDPSPSRISSPVQSGSTTTKKDNAGRGRPSS